MKKLTTVLAIMVCTLAGCTTEVGVSPTIPPMVPSGHMAGAVFPAKVAGYTALGPTPKPGQLEVTYARDTQPLDLAVVSFDPTGEFGEATLDGQLWYGASRCGILWEKYSDTTPAPSQAACITVLTDGVMTTVAGGTQSPENLSALANAIYSGLS